MPGGSAVRRLLRPGLWPWHLLVAVVAATFVYLGVWQIGRHEQLQDRNALLERRLAAATIPYLDARAAFDPDATVGSDADPSYRAVEVEGTFAPEQELLLRGRSLDGQPGHHVLTPLLTSEEGVPTGRAVLVDRGWVPYRLDDPDLPRSAPPEGTVRIEGRLMPEADEPIGPLAAFAPRDPPDGPLDVAARADVDRLQPQMPFPLDRFVIELERYVRPQDAAADAELPIVPPAPGPESGPHLSYAAQWFFFAAVAVVGYGLLLRRTAREDG